MQEFDLTSLKPQAAYQLLTHVVLPRPIAFVSTLSPEGIGNLAPFSFFNLGGLVPPSISFCPVNNRVGFVKDTVRNIEANGEYVINVVTRAMTERMNQCSWSYPPEVDEMEAVGFTALASKIVKPPRVAESPVQIECRLHRIVRHGEGPLASNYIIGEVQLMHIDESVLSDGLPDAAKLDLVGRLGGELYNHVNAESLFSLPRPEGPEIK